MDNLTHLGVGALCAIGVAKLARRRCAHTHDAERAKVASPATWLVILTGAIAGNFPDIDIVTYLINPLYYDAYWHRGATHSLVLAPLWALLLTAILWLTLWRRRNGVLLYSICLAGIVSHILVDVLTSWPTSLWYPISHSRPALGIIFIIDLVVTITVYIALWAAVYQRRVLLITSVSVMLCWPLFAYTQQQRALQAASSEHTEDLQAWAQPFSVFHWKVVAPTAQGFDVMYLRLGERQPIPWPFAWMQQSVEGYPQITQAHWQTRLTTPDAKSLAAWHDPAMYAVRDFMTYPILHKRSDECIWFSDMLFAVPGLPAAFVYGACDTPTGISIERQPNPAPWSHHDD